VNPALAFGLIIGAICALWCGIVYLVAEAYYWNKRRLYTKATLADFDREFGTSAR
jgi:hypothetical protein